jgi:hypothetical protein
MDLVSAVANLQKERDYYKESSKEQQEIIKQLTEGPGEFEYIHPYDVGVLMNNLHVSQLIKFSVHGTDNEFFELDGKKYKQSVFIPAKTKSIK